MKSYWHVLIAGALLASTSIASQGDPSAAERFHAKTGRYMVTAANQSCTKQCCGHKAAVANLQAGNAETERLNRFFEAKLGRRLNNQTRSTTVIAKATAEDRECDCPMCCE